MRIKKARVIPSLFYFLNNTEQTSKKLHCISDKIQITKAKNIFKVQKQKDLLQHKFFNVGMNYSQKSK
jgi:hypothetical protein